VPPRAVAPRIRRNVLNLYILEINIKYIILKI